jgi:phage-related protein
MSPEQQLAYLNRFPNISIDRALYLLEVAEGWYILHDIQKQLKRLL